MIFFPTFTGNTAWLTITVLSCPIYLLLFFTDCRTAFPVHIPIQSHSVCATPVASYHASSDMLFQCLSNPRINAMVTLVSLFLSSLVLFSPVLFATHCLSSSKALTLPSHIHISIQSNCRLTPTVLSCPVPACLIHYLSHCILTWCLTAF